MQKVKMFKMPFETKHFNKNQKVWIVSLSGAMSALVRGKFRGKYKYISAWVSWSTKQKQNPEIKEIIVSNNFAKRLDI